MLIKKSQATLEVSTDREQIFDYPLADKEYGVSYQELNGRSPEKGFYINKVCFEVFYLIDGSAMVEVDEKKFQVEPGDLIVLQPGQKHFGEYSNAKMITFTSPDWYEEQCEVVED